MLLAPEPQELSQVEQLLTSLEHLKKRGAVERRGAGARLRRRRAPTFCMWACLEAHACL